MVWAHPRLRAAGRDIVRATRIRPDGGRGIDERAREVAVVSFGHFERGLTSDEQAWLACVTAMGGAGALAVEPLLGTAAGRRVLGRGGGGDTTIEVDRAAEEAMHAALDRTAPAAYSLVSEELGYITTPDASWWIAVDPVDGSLNAKRGLEPSCAALAVADRPTVGDVRVAHVRDYARGHVFSAVRGAGFISSRTELEWPSVGAPVEVVLLEAGRPDRHGFAYGDLAQVIRGQSGQELRVRQIGSLALCLCHLASGVADVLLAPVPSRAVDVAGGLLMVRETGGGAASLDGSDLWTQPLDLERRAPFVAWRRGLDGRDLVEAARAVFY